MPSWSPAPHGVPFWSEVSPVLTLPRASARPKRFAPGKTLMPGGIHFRRADFILTWAPMRRLRRPMGHTRPGIWPGTPSWSPAPHGALCWSKSGLSPDSARRVKDAAPYAWGAPGGENCLPCRGGYHPPEICQGNASTICRGDLWSPAGGGTGLRRPPFLPKEMGEKKGRGAPPSLGPPIRGLMAAVRRTGRAKTDRASPLVFLALMLQALPRLGRHASGLPGKP